MSLHKAWYVPKWCIIGEEMFGLIGARMFIGKEISSGQMFIDARGII